MDRDGIVYRRFDSGETWPWPISLDILMVKHAQDALTFYEKEQSTKFELVGLYPCSRKISVIIPSIDENLGDWVHISFLAKPLGNDHHHVDPKFFSAELVYYNNSFDEFRVTHCSLLDPSDPGLTYECGICHPSRKIPHSSGYLVGRWSYRNGDIPDSVYESHWFQEEMTGNGSNKRHRLDLNKLFKGNVPTLYVRRHMKPLDFAELALELHKKEQDEEFELVEALGLSRWVTVHKTPADFLHINFTAKPRNAKCTESDNVSPKLFFAELYAYRAEEYKVAHCSIVEPNDPGVTYECKFCTPNKKIAHPIEYQAVGANPKGFQHAPVLKPPRYTFVEKFYTKGSLDGEMI
ncbi:hypothetical protein M5689_012065 [Euphorbia peplus]|nr:hypothetical protein M5689_012065 [Euphorbia peplus]